MKYEIKDVVKWYVKGILALIGVNITLQLLQGQFNPSSWINITFLTALNPIMKFVAAPLITGFFLEWIDVWGDKFIR